MSRTDRDLRVGQMVSVSPEAKIQLAATVARTPRDRLVLRLIRPSTTHPIQKGEQVRIKCWDLEEAFYFECQVLEVSGTNDDHLVIPKPRAGVVIQRRKAYRVHEPIPLSFTVIEAADREMVGRDFPDLRIRDLTVGGLAFETELFMEAGDKLDMNLELPPSQTVNALGSVIRCLPVEREEGSLNAVSMKFFQLDIEGQNRLLLFLAQSRPPDEQLDALWVG